MNILGRLKAMIFREPVESKLREPAQADERFHEDIDDQFQEPTPTASRDFLKGTASRDLLIRDRDEDA